MWLVQIIFLALFYFFYVSAIQSCWVSVSGISLILEGTCTLSLSPICDGWYLCLLGIVISWPLYIEPVIFKFDPQIKNMCEPLSKREQSINLRIQKQGSRDERSNKIEEVKGSMPGKHSEEYIDAALQGMMYMRRERNVLTEEDSKPSQALKEGWNIEEKKKRKKRKWVSTNDIYWQQRFNYSFLMIIIWVTKLFNWSVLDAIK